MRTLRRSRGTAATGMSLALAAGLTLAVLGTASPAAAAGGTITIDPPGSPTAGPVTLRGTVGLDPGEVTSVVYVYDATDSTESPAGADCSNNGALGPEDDFNADGGVGDVLDCEIAGVVALNNSLAATSAVQAGIVAFANKAAAADLDPVGSATFLPPGYTGGDPRPRLETVARSVVRGEIGLYDPKPLGGSGAGTAFDNAVQAALATLAGAPAGPKWIMFLSDGQAPIDDGVLAQLSGSGVKLRSFGIGQDATCAKSSSLSKMAAATGEACTLVPQPAALTAGLTGSQPDAVNSVSVTIEDVSLAASVNAVGGWSATFNLGAGHLHRHRQGAPRLGLDPQRAPDDHGRPGQRRPAAGQRLARSRLSQGHGREGRPAEALEVSSPVRGDRPGRAAPAGADGDEEAQQCSGPAPGPRRPPGRPGRRSTATGWTRQVGSRSGRSRRPGSRC